MFERQINKTADILRSHGCSLKCKLSEDQIKEAEYLYNISLPPDLNEMLLSYIPDPFYNYGNMRKESIAHIKKMINWPTEGVLSDIQSNDFWLDEWGTKPNSIERSLEIAKNNLCHVKPLIPLFSHRFIPSCPNEAGNPVYSFWQASDVIYYGKDLWDYIEIEFGGKPQSSISWDEIKAGIPFWGELVS